MTPQTDALALLPLCDLFSDIDVTALPPSAQEALKSEIEIVRLERGDVLMKQGDPADCMYIVVSGRFEIVVEGPDRNRNLVGEVRSGESVESSGSSTEVLAWRPSLPAGTVSW